MNNQTRTTSIGRGLRRGTLALALGAALLLPTLAPATDGPSAAAAGYYKPCPSFTYKGEHKLFKHKVGCRKAKRKSKYVLRTHRAPRGWKCSLSELPNGYAACRRGR